MAPVRAVHLRSVAKNGGDIERFVAREVRLASNPKEMLASFMQSVLISPCADPTVEERRFRDPEDATRVSAIRFICYT